MRNVNINLLILILIFSCTGLAAEVQKPTTLLQRKQQAIKRMELRKRAFDQHLKYEETRERKRISRANEIKKIRKAREIKKEAARRNFRREKQRFSNLDYQKLLQRRATERRLSEEARQKYSHIEKQLKKIYQNKRYKINESEEFNL